MATTTTTHPRIALLSTAIPFREDGEYSYSQKSLLIPHETLRREFAYGRKALDHLDAVKHPWKAYCWNEWMSTFFAPSIHGHHDLEEQCFFVYYKKLGVDTPVRMTDDHKALVKMLDVVVESSRKLLDVVKINGGPDAINAAVAETKANFIELVERMEAHLLEEETFWPAQIEKHGEVRLVYLFLSFVILIFINFISFLLFQAEYQKCEKQLIDWGIKNEGQNFQTLACAVIYATGSEIGGIPHYPDDTIWAGEKSRQQLLNGFPASP
jgi:hypothetical protein